MTVAATAGHVHAGYQGSVDSDRVGELLQHP